MIVALGDAGKPRTTDRHRGTNRSRLWLALLVGAGLLLCSTAHAAPCPRAYRLPAGATAPCTGELLPSPTLDALLEQMDAARRLKVQLDEDAAHAAAAAREADAKATAADNAHRAEVEAVERAGAARLAAADAHVAEIERQVRALTEPEPSRWTWPRVLGVVVSTGAAVALGYLCARDGEAVTCLGSGVGAGIGVGLAL